MSQFENIEAIERRLWGSADTLRSNSNYASNDYFLQGMGLVSHLKLETIRVVVGLTNRSWESTHFDTCLADASYRRRSTR